MKTTFTLNENEQEKLDSLNSKWFKKYGVHGKIKYKFSPTGIGDKIEVKNSIEGEWIDITDYNSW